MVEVRGIFLINLEYGCKRNEDKRWVILVWNLVIYYKCRGWNVMGYEVFKSLRDKCGKIKDKLDFGRG